MAIHVSNALAQPTPDSVRFDTAVLVTPEVYPEFPGGSEQWLEFVRMEMKYPLAGETCKEGRVYVEFHVELDGSISNARVRRGVDPELDAEALRIIRAMPRWEPGTMSGQPFVFTMVAPVVFKLK